MTGPSSAIENGGRLASFSSRTSDATTSTSPVSSLAFTVSALRRSTVPVTPTTISVRSFLASWTSASLSRTTTWVTP